MKLLAGSICALVLLASALPAAEQQPSEIRLATKDAQNHSIVVPMGGQPSILLFIRTSQPQSADAMKQVLLLDPHAQIVAVISGPAARDEASALKGWPHAVVADPGYEISGSAAVRVWPTAIVLSPSGTIKGHIAGVPKSFADDLGAYVNFAGGIIDAQQLQAKLSQHNEVKDDLADEAARHLRVAMQNMNSGALDTAQKEITAGLTKQPGNPLLQLAQARLLLLRDQPEQALAVLDRILSSTVPAVQANVLRARALRQIGKVDEAEALLVQATKLNPDPAEADYELGRVYEQKGKLDLAANCYRQAFEHTETGRLSVATTRPK